MWLWQNETRKDKMYELFPRFYIEHTPHNIDIDELKKGHARARERKLREKCDKKFVWHVDALNIIGVTQTAHSKGIENQVNYFTFDREKLFFDNDKYKWILVYPIVIDISSVFQYNKRYFILMSSVSDHLKM